MYQQARLQTAHLIISVMTLALLLFHTFITLTSQSAAGAGRAAAIAPETAANPPEDMAAAPPDGEDIMAVAQKAESIVSNMTTDEKIYQLIIAAPEDITGVKTVIQAGETTRIALMDKPVGGFIYSSANYENPVKFNDIVANTAEFSKIAPLFLYKGDSESKTLPRQVIYAGESSVDLLSVMYGTGFADMIIAENAAETAKMLKNQIYSGTITENMLNERVIRVLVEKIKRGIID